MANKKFYCKPCKKYQQENYQSQAYQVNVKTNIANLLVEGISLRGIARVLKITLKTVINKIKLIAQSIRRPSYSHTGGVIEIDELWTYVGSKKEEVWITYGMERKSNAIIDFVVGSRTRENLQTITRTSQLLNPNWICTDGLNTYKNLIPVELHKIGLPHTRHIERFNLNLKTHLKRLSRKTICFSRSKEMLEACLRIYFWGNKFPVR